MEKRFLQPILDSEECSHLGAMQSAIPEIYIAKYNRFVDNIVGRINKILSKSFDPVRVKLQSPETKTKKNKGKKRKVNKRNNSRPKMAPAEMNKMMEFNIARSGKYVVHFKTAILRITSIVSLTDQQRVSQENLHSF